MAFLALVLNLSIFALVHGYTPTFKNEPTHPLKAPTESTLGLQVNDETAARTKSNEPANAKHETVFSGGNHFEYLLLNDSNILLTSLQNDGPFDTAAAQFASSKQKHQSRKNDNTQHNATTDSSKSVQIEATLPPRNVTAQSDNNVTVRIISKTNFKIEPPVESSRPINTFGGKSLLGPVNLGHQLIGSQNVSFDRRPLKTTQFLVDPLTRTEPDDYDDAFTKLLISNGILKPSTSRLIPHQRHNFNVDDVAALLKRDNSASGSIGTQEIVSTNNTKIKANENVNVSMSENPKYVGTTIRTIPGLSAYRTELFNKTLVDPTINSPSKHGENMNNAYKNTYEDEPEISDGNSSGRILQNTNSSNAKTFEKTPIRTVFSRTTQEEHSESSPRNSVSQHLGEPVNKSQEPISKVMMPAKTVNRSTAEVSGTTSDNLSRSLDSDEAFRVSNNANSDATPEAASLKMPPPRSTLNVFDGMKDDDQTEDRQLSIPEFENVLKSIVQELFGSVTDYVARLNESDRSHEAALEASDLMYISRFVLFNATKIVQKLRKKPYISVIGVQGPNIDRTLNRPSSWTNLLDNSTVPVIRYVYKLFDEDGSDSDFFWFGVPLNQMGPSPYPLLKKSSVVTLFETNLAVRIYLEYRGRKIEAVFALPRTLLPNISFSAPKLSVDVNTHIPVNSNRSETVELFCSRVTLFKHNSQSYHILELGILRHVIRYNISKEKSQEEIETIIYVCLGSACFVCFFGSMLFCLCRGLRESPSPVPFIYNYRFLGRPKQDRRQHPRDSLKVIFSKNFDREDVKPSWLLDNSQLNDADWYLYPFGHNPPSKFIRDDVNSHEETKLCGADAEGLEAVDSPRLNKENKVPMMGYRSYCVLPPHTRTHDGDERSFENPNYNPDTR